MRPSFEIASVVEYALVFGLFSLTLAGLAVLVGGPAWLLLWPATSFGLLAAAYGGLGPKALGKRPDGRLAPWAVVLLLPYLLINGLVWHLHRLLTRQPCYHEVVPGLWLGRRALPHELPPGVEIVIDLTAEFHEPLRVRHGRAYHCLPTLDTLAPPEPGFREVIAKVASATGPVYIHCALGYGRSAMFVAAVLLARGLARDVVDAELFLRRVRPGVGLTPIQRAFLRRLAERT